MTESTSSRPWPASLALAASLLVAGCTHAPPSDEPGAQALARGERWLPQGPGVPALTPAELVRRARAARALCGAGVDDAQVLALALADFDRASP